MKICKRCKIEKELTEFHSMGKDNKYLNPYCKDCIKAIRKESREKYRTIPRDYKKSIDDTQFHLKEYIDFCNKNLPKKDGMIDFNAPIVAGEFDDYVGDHEMIASFKGKIPKEWEVRAKYLNKWEFDRVNKMQQESLL